MASYLRGACLLLLAGVPALSCGGSGGTNQPPPQPQNESILLDRTDQLTVLDPRAGTAPYDDYLVAVNAGDRLEVSLTSAAFDPVLEVTPPGAAALVNDDYQGNRQASYLELIAAVTGPMKVRATSYGITANGSYRLQVRRVNAQGQVGQANLQGAGQQPVAQWPTVVPGQPAAGELGQGDAVAPDGSWVDQWVVPGSAAAPMTLRVAGGGPAPRVVLVDPLGASYTPAPDGSLVLARDGAYRLQVIAPAARQSLRYQITTAPFSGGAGVTQLARTHHQLPQLPATAAVAIGQHVQGALEGTDARLPSGEPADIYQLAAATPGEVTLELESSALDPYLMVIGPAGQLWENDDSGGTRNASLTLQLPAAGAYRIVATSYQPNETGRYDLKVWSGQRVAQVGVATNTAAPQPQSIAGALQQGDAQLNSGEFADTHEVQWTAGQTVRVEVTSTAFDTYLIIRRPSGTQSDNDDQSPQNRNAALDYTVTETGTHRILVTSYQPGESGPYQLLIRGPAGSVPPTQPGPGPVPGPQPQPPPQAIEVAGAQTIRGALATGDERLRSGEWVDGHALRFTPGSSVRIRLSSTQFDPYLIVRTPSGQQHDNDDVSSGVRDAQVEIPAAEAGDYRVMATSYQPGETGNYVLRVERGDSVPTAQPPIAIPGPGPSPQPGPGPQPQLPQPAAGGGRVFGVFAGITDYPGATNDLAECANDAIKLAEALSQTGLLTPDRQILLTDAQSTVGNLRLAMQRMAQQVGPSDVFVFFYSGHGGRTGGGSQDAREIDGADEYLAVYDGNLMDDELGTLFDGIRARTSIVALDACFAGGFAKDVITRPGRVGMFSSEEDVTSSVAGNFQAGGYLSHFLRLAMSGQADSDPPDGVLTVGELTHWTWQQFGRHASDVRMSMGYQHLVVDRGAVGAGQVLWAYRR